MHLTAVGCSARSLRGNAKKKALGRTSEPRPKPSTVAPISRRSPSFAVPVFKKHRYPSIGNVVFYTGSSVRCFRNLLLFCFGNRSAFSAYGGRGNTALFSKKNLTTGPASKLISIKLTIVVSKQSLETTLRRTNVGFKQQEPILRM